MILIEHIQSDIHNVYEDIEKTLEKIRKENKDKEFIVTDIRTHWTTFFHGECSLKTENILTEIVYSLIDKKEGDDTDGN